MSGDNNPLNMETFQNLMKELLREQGEAFATALLAQRHSIMEEVEHLIRVNSNAAKAGTSKSPAKQTDVGKEPEATQKEPIHLDLTQEEPSTASELERKWSEKFQKLEKTLKALKTHDKLIDVDSLVLFPGARLPPKFKMPQMDKFNGTTCPKTHLKMYVGALSPLGVNNELLAQLFQQSLTGPALRWFVRLDNDQKKSWDSICNAFNQQYHYNIEVDITRRDLETTKQQHQESFSAFLTRWRAKAAQMVNRPTEQEQIDILVKNLLPVYQTRLQTQYLPNFQALIQTASKIEDLIQNGHLKYDSSKFQKNSLNEDSPSSQNEGEVAVISLDQPANNPRTFTDLDLGRRNDNHS